MAQMESAVNQAKEAPAPRKETLEETNQKLSLLQAEVSAQQAKLPEGWSVNGKGELVKPAVNTDDGMVTRLYNWLTSVPEGGGYVPSAASSEVQAIAAPLAPITTLLKGPAQNQ